MNRRRIVNTICVLALNLVTLPARAEDLDNDGIPDAFEDQLLEQFAPVIIRNGYTSEWEEFLGIPVSAAWFVQHADLGISPGDGSFTPVLANPTPESLLLFSLNIVQTGSEWPGNLYLHFRDPDYKWGDSPTDPTHWQDAINRRRGVYGRVWRPWPDCYPNIYSVQYFMLMTWNDPFTDFLDNGRHDGDLMCVDYGVDNSLPGGPRIVHAIYHNHGRQIFITPDALRFTNGHPMAFLEAGSNEPWPNASYCCQGGWPTNDGVALTGIGGILWFGEDEAVANHQGRGNIYETGPVPNIGEAYRANEGDDFPNSFYPLGSLDNQLFLYYPGPWGRRGDPPEGPAYQRKMWLRKFSGPWSRSSPCAESDPLRPNLEALAFSTSCIQTNGTNIHCFDFLPVCDVRATHVGEQKGLPSKPYTTVTRGTQKVGEYGVLRVAAGTYSETLEISKPMLVESAGGMVTIGR